MTIELSAAAPGEQLYRDMLIKDNHHLIFIKRDYSEGRGKQFRELPCLVVPEMDREAHNLLHDLWLPPKRPENRTMGGYIERHRLHHCSCYSGKLKAVSILHLAGGVPRLPLSYLGCLVVWLPPSTIRLVDQLYRRDPSFGDWQLKRVVSWLHERHRRHECACYHLRNRLLVPVQSPVA